MLAIRRRQVYKGSNTANLSGGPVTAAAAAFKEPQGLYFHGGAVLYACAATLAGFAGLFAASFALNAVAVLLLAHGMIIAAYLVHECAHNTVFRDARRNARLGRALSWLCGACYGTFEDIRYKHFRHHVDNDDVVWFDYDAFFARHAWLTRAVKVLEWLYIPAHDVLMHAIMVFTSFVIPERREQRARNVAVIALRGGAFVALAVWFPKVAVLYVLAYLIMIQVLRFMDMLQHDYPYNTTLYRVVTAPHRGDSDWEQAHTFSNPLSLRHERLNWLVLNFGFHNAHHSDMSVPWYRLPELHRELTGGDPRRVIPLSSQLRLFHSNRVRRVHNEQPENYPQGDDYLATARAGRGAIGGNAASFLTSF